MIPLLRSLLVGLGLLSSLQAGEAEPPTMGGPQANPAVLAPAIAPSVGWRAGDRIILVGDLLISSNQPELALRLQEALTASRPGLDLIVRGVQGHGVVIRSWQEALANELIRRPAQVVVIGLGVGDALAAKNSKSQPLAVGEWRAALADMVRAARVVGAAVVIATPTVFGDKPADGPFFNELEAYAAAARSLATETKSELCELRQPLLAILAEKNAKGTIESGLLSRVPGQFRVPAMDLIAGRLATSIAAAVANIPWSIAIPNTTFPASGAGGKAEVKVVRTTAAKLAIYVTTDGSDPTEKSPLYVEPIAVTATTHLRALAVAADQSGRRTAEGWCMAATKRKAESGTPETLPGLWVDHYTFKRWRAPIPAVDSFKPDFETWHMGCDLGAISRVPVHRWPNNNFGLRFSGFFVAPYDGTYIFSTNSDDASRLSIGDAVVARNDEKATARWAYGAVELAKGLHPFTLVYGQGPGAAILEVYVALPGQRPHPLPDLLLRRPLVKTIRKSLEPEKDEDEEDPTAAKPGEELEIK